MFVFFRNLIVFLLLGGLFTACSSKDEFYEGMYHGIKHEQKLKKSYPEENEESLEKKRDLDYKQYNDELEKSSF